MSLSNVVESLQPYIENGGNVQLIEKVAGQQQSYIWDRKPRGPQDDKDKTFLHQMDSGEGPYECRKIRSTHSYGYHGFFKPCLYEVAQALSAAGLGEHKRYYVTTQSCDGEGKPSRDPNDMVDGDTHRGLTTVYFLAGIAEP
jgi:hypothetical protein